MKITVERHGGFAAITKVWTVTARTTTARNQWDPLVEACPWDAVPNTLRDAAKNRDSGQADRFMYAIRAGAHRAALPEQDVTGPWRVLVDSAKEAADESPGTRRADERR